MKLLRFNITLILILFLSFTVVFSKEINATVSGITEGEVLVKVEQPGQSVSVGNKVDFKLNMDGFELESGTGNVSRVKGSDVWVKVVEGSPDIDHQAVIYTSSSSRRKSSRRTRTKTKRKSTSSWLSKSSSSSSNASTPSLEESFSKAKDSFVSFFGGSKSSSEDTRNKNTNTYEAHTDKSSAADSSSRTTEKTAYAKKESLASTTSKSNGAKGSMTNPILDKPITKPASVMTSQAISDEAKLDIQRRIQAAKPQVAYNARPAKLYTPPEIPYKNCVFKEYQTGYTELLKDPNTINYVFSHPSEKFHHGIAGYAYLTGIAPDGRRDPVKGREKLLTMKQDEILPLDVFNIALTFHLGDGTMVNTLKAATLYKQWVAHEAWLSPESSVDDFPKTYPFVYHNLGCLYLNGRGLEKNKTYAKNLFTQAAKYNFQSSQKMLEQLQ